MIGRRISYLREQKHLSQQDVAAQVTTDQIAHTEADTQAPCPSFRLQMYDVARSAGGSCR